MYKKLRWSFSLLLCITIALMNPLSSMAAPEKEADNTLIISSIEDFLTFSENCRLDSYSKNLSVRLESDIDLSGTSFDSIPIFYGTFDGNKHRIKGLSLTSDGSVKGLFRYTQETAIVKNLIIEGKIAPDGSRKTIGGLSGNNAGLIQNCVFSGSVTGSENIGGLVGINEVTGIIENCQVYGAIHGDHFVGGIAGENNGVIRNCENLTKLNTTVEENNIEISDITIDSLTSSESVVTSTDIGGITGANSGVIRNCENHGTIGYQHIGYNIGGISGNNIGYIANCTNYSKIWGRKEIGGIVGQIEPASTLDYKADTFQILENQFNTLSELTNRAASNAENNANVNDSDLNTLSSELKKAQKALEQLESNSGTPDWDQLLASQTVLAGSLSKILETSGKIASSNQGTTDALSKDLEAITKQAGKISSTLSNTSSNLGVTFSDVSDKDTADNFIGKIADCNNLGSIQGDLNVGGIAGAISLENDLDPEEDIQVVGNESMNFNYEIRSVIRNCTNQGQIVAKRQGAGGIAGFTSMGLIHSCTNTGEINAEMAVYVGGIAGESHGYIRNCNTKCILSASSYAGGIAGLASTVSDCRSMIQISGSTEKTGAILGDKTEDFSYKNNYYLPVKTDLGGIDGISFEDLAKPLSEEDFFALENLPDMFKKQTLKFVFDGESSKNITIEYGNRIHVADIPSVPKKSGYRGTWDGYDELISSELVFDTTFHTIYTPLSTTTQSRDTRTNGAPILLAVGEFTTDNTIKLSSSDYKPVLSKNQVLVEVIDYNVPGSNIPVSLRYNTDKKYSPESITILSRTEDGLWQNTDFTVSESYLVFDIDNLSGTFSVIYTKPDYTPKIVLISGGILLIMSILVLTVRKKKQSKHTN